MVTKLLAKYFPEDGIPSVKPPALDCLRDIPSGVVVVAHKDDTSALRNALEAEGFLVDEVRGPYSSEQLRFSASTRCLVNHANARRIVET